MKTVFFYGLFMDQSLLQEKGLNPCSPRVAYVEGYGLRIGERATLVKSAGERSYGVVMSLEESELRQLYDGEGLSDYVPESIVAIDTSNQTLPAISYNLPLEKLTGRNKQYADALITLGRKLGLPAEYITQLEIRNQ